MVLIDYTQTGGGAACAFGAGFEYGLRERNLHQYIGRARGYSGGVLNQAVGIGGQADKLLALYKDIVPRLIDKGACVRKVSTQKMPLLRRFVDCSQPIVHIDVLQETIDDFINAPMQEALLTSDYPLYALAARKRKTEFTGPEYLPVQELGVQALKASCCITACVQVNGKSYTDPGFHTPFPADRWFHESSANPEVIVMNTGKPNKTGWLEAKAFFEGQFGSEGYKRYKTIRQQEKHHFEQLYRLAARHRKPILRLRSKTPISFSTTNTAIIEAAYEEGIRSAARVEDFLSDLTTAQAA